MKPQYAVTDDSICFVRENVADALTEGIDLRADARIQPELGRELHKLTDVLDGDRQILAPVAQLSSTESYQTRG